MCELVCYFVCLFLVIVWNNLFVLSIWLFCWFWKLVGWCGVLVYSVVVFV